MKKDPAPRPRIMGAMLGWPCGGVLVLALAALFVLVAAVTRTTPVVPVQPVHLELAPPPPGMLPLNAH